MARHPAEASDPKFAALMDELNRLSLSASDLREANAYAEMLELHKSTRPEPESDWRGKAITVALAVSYARPFSSNKDRDGKYEKLGFLAPMLAKLTEGELVIHNEIIGDRHHFFAHTDAEFTPVHLVALDGPKGKDRAFMQIYRHVAYSPAKAKQIRANIVKLRSLVDSRLKTLQAEVKAIDAAFQPEGGG